MVDKRKARILAKVVVEEEEDFQIVKDLAKERLFQSYMENKRGFDSDWNEVMAGNQRIPIMITELGLWKAICFLSVLISGSLLVALYVFT